MCVNWVIVSFKLTVKMNPLILLFCQFKNDAIFMLFSLKRDKKVHNIHVQRMYRIEICYVQNSTPNFMLKCLLSAMSRTLVIEKSEWNFYDSGLGQYWNEFGTMLWGSELIQKFDKIWY